MGKRSRKRADERVHPPDADLLDAAPERPSAAARSRSRDRTRELPEPQGPAPSGRRPGQSRMDRFVEKADARPKPPWHPVPLIELSVLVGIVLIVIGIINNSSSSGRLALVFGLALASLAGLDTAAREHYNGFRSHSTLLAGMPAVVAVAALALLGAPFVVYVPAAVVVFAGGFWFFRRAFRARAGVAFKA